LPSRRSAAFFPPGAPHEARCGKRSRTSDRPRDLGLEELDELREYLSGRISPDNRVYRQTPEQCDSAEPGGGLIRGTRANSDRERNEQHHRAVPPKVLNLQLRESNDNRQRRSGEIFASLEQYDRGHERDDDDHGLSIGGTQDAHSLRPETSRRRIHEEERDHANQARRSEHDDRSPGPRLRPSSTSDGMLECVHGQWNQRRGSEMQKRRGGEPLERALMLVPSDRRDHVSTAGDVR